jgi:hypothetical protein
MSGGLLQLVAQGAQDAYLTTQPSITFWKSVYRRHTNHAVESVENTFSGTADFGKKVIANIARNGDLVSNMYLQVTLPSVAEANSSWVNAIGYAMIKSVEVEVGGQKIDKHYGEWLKIWSEVTSTAEKRAGLDEMIGQVSALTNTMEAETVGADIDSTSAPWGTLAAASNAAQTLYIPLAFWFCNGNPGSALPMIALQYHEMRVSVEFRTLAELIRGDAALTGLSITDASLYVDYVFLDNEERTRFSQAAHEYLITQVQFLGDESIAANSPNQKIRLNLNHPVKAIYWVITRDDRATTAHAAGNQWFDFGDTGTADRVVNATITLNGHERFSTRPGSYFRLVQPYQHHTRVPTQQVYMYSFALNVESSQPSGSCNFSRIDNATLVLTLDDVTALGNQASKIKVFALNHNIFRITSGMGGIAYSN